MGQTGQSDFAYGPSGDVIVLPTRAARSVPAPPAPAVSSGFHPPGLASSFDQIGSTMPESINPRTNCGDPARHQDPRPPAAPAGPSAWIVIVVIVAYAVLTVCGVPRQLALAGLTGSAAIGVRAAASVLRTLLTVEPGDV